LEGPISNLDGMMLFARDVMRRGNYSAQRSRDCDPAASLCGQIACDSVIVWVRMICAAGRRKNYLTQRNKGTK
jgi:hypothetical protein